MDQHWAHGIPIDVRNAQVVRLVEGAVPWLSPRVEVVVGDNPDDCPKWIGSVRRNQGASCILGLGLSCEGDGASGQLAWKPLGHIELRREVDARNRDAVARTELVHAFTERGPEALKQDPEQSEWVATVVVLADAFLELVLRR